MLENPRAARNAPIQVRTIPPPTEANRGAKAPVIPSAGECQVWIDFDGTISKRDVLDDLIAKFAVDDSWLKVEDLWRAGQIGSRECLSAEFALISISDQDLDQFLDQVELDDGFAGLIAMLSEKEVPKAILSDGIERFIGRILRRHGVDSLEVRANAVARSGKSMRLECPRSSTQCTSAAAHCKCASARELHQGGRFTIYIGDGRSDLCPSRVSDCVFAKGALAAALTAEGRSFIPFTTLDDVRRVLAGAWGQNA